MFGSKRKSMMNKVAKQAMKNSMEEIDFQVGMDETLAKIERVLNKMNSYKREVNNDKVDAIRLLFAHLESPDNGVKFMQLIQFLKK